MEQLELTWEKADADRHVYSKFLFPRFGLILWLHSIWLPLANTSELTFAVFETFQTANLAGPRKAHNLATLADSIALRSKIRTICEVMNVHLMCLMVYLRWCIHETKDLEWPKMLMEKLVWIWFS